MEVGDTITVSVCISRGEYAELTYASPFFTLEWSFSPRVAQTFAMASGYQNSVHLAIF
jgi:hypothetical protein